jgi:hypothetical protein
MFFSFNAAIGGDRTLTISVTIYEKPQSVVRIEPCSAMNMSSVFAHANRQLYALVRFAVTPE